MNSEKEKIDRAEVLLYAILGVLTLIMGFDGIMKLMGNSHHVRQFEDFGYAAWFMYATGALELLSAVLIWFAITRFQASAVILAIMVFAAMTNVKFGQYDAVFLNLGIGLLAIYSAFQSRAGCVLLSAGR